MLRMYGDLMPIKFRDTVAIPNSKSYIHEILPAVPEAALRAGKDPDFSYVSEEGGRFRVNVFRKITGLGAVFRHIPRDVPTLEKLDVAARRSRSSATITRG